MQPQISSPERVNTFHATDSNVPETPVDSTRRITISFSAPTQRSRRMETNNSTFVMSNSSGKDKSNSRRFGSNYEGSYIDDEESVLVASPFAYVTPPMPPREEVSNTKTTKAMAKIVEEEGTPDSVIRKLSFMNPVASNDSSYDDQPVPGTVNRVARVKSVDSDEENADDSFRYPIATPSQEMSCVPKGDNSSSDGFSRLSLSMVDLNPPNSPMRPGASRIASTEASTVPDLLINCPCCGKQFISDKHLADHSEFCRSDSRGVRSGEIPENHSEMKQDVRNSVMSLASMSSDMRRQVGSLSESPALPLYMQRAMAAAAASTSPTWSLPPVGPLPHPPSPSILASPTELRESNDDDFLEEEISTFLECLRSDVRNTASEAIEKEEKKCRRVHQPVSSGSSSSDGSLIISERQKAWAARRTRKPSPQALVKRVRLQNSLCVSSDDEDGCSDAPARTVSNTGLMFVPARKPSPPPPLPPPVPMASNISINSPIPERSSFDQELSMTTSFLVGPFQSSPSMLVAQSVSHAGRASPTFGLRGSMISFRSSKSCGDMEAVQASVASELNAPPSVTDSAMTLMRISVNSASGGIRYPCRSCGRKFATASRLDKHEAVCESVFKPVKPVAFRPLATHPSNSSSRDVSPRSSSGQTCTCRHCGRSFSHTDKLAKHEHICLSVFKGSQKRPKTAAIKREPSGTPSASFIDSSDRDTSVKTTVTPIKLRIRDTRIMISCDMVILDKGVQGARLSLESFKSVCVAPSYIAQRPKLSTFSVASQSSSDEPPFGGLPRRERLPVVDAKPVHQSSALVSTVGSADESSFNASSVSSSLNRTSLEFQYHLLREQIRKCSERLKQRQRSSSDSISVRDG